VINGVEFDIGGLTSGSTGTPMFFDLPGGGQFRVCTINTSLSGVGVEPDIIVTRTIKGIAEGKDEVLEAALRYINPDFPKRKEINYEATNKHSLDYCGWASNSGIHYNPNTQT